MDSVACNNYCLAIVLLLVTVLLQAGIIQVLAVTSTATTITDNNNSSQPLWLKRESEALAGIPWWSNMIDSTSHCDWDGIKCNKAGSVTSISCPHNYYDEVDMNELHLSSFQNLEILHLNGCGLKGTIPYEIGMLSKLTKLHLQHNSISGNLPSSLTNLTSLIILDISYNYIHGSIPFKELGNLKNLTILNLSRNLFSGPIPSSVGFLTLLKDLDLSGNQLLGFIPIEIMNLSNLSYLDLSYNFFSGTVPANLSYLSNIKFINLSYNKLVGPVPTSFRELCSSSKIMLMGNDGLEGNLSCGLEMKDQNKRPSRVRHFIPIIILPVSISLALWTILGTHRFFSRSKAVKNKSVSVTTKHGNMCSIWNYDGTIAYEDIIRSTNDFDIEHCIGTGGYGSVYRAQLPSGKVVALKKLHRFEA